MFVNVVPMTILCMAAPILKTPDKFDFVVTAEKRLTFVVDAFLSCCMVLQIIVVEVKLEYDTAELVRGAPYVISLVVKS